MPEKRFTSHDIDERVRAPDRICDEDAGDPSESLVGPDVTAVVSAWREAMQYDPIVVGGIAVALILGNTALLDLPFSVPLLMAAGAGATLIYGLDRWPALSPEDRWVHPRRVAWVRRHGTWLQVERGVCIAVVVASAFVLHVETVVVAAGFGILGVLHVTPVWPGRRRLKSFGWGRRVSVAFVWATASVLLPLLEAQPPFEHVPGLAFAWGAGGGARRWAEGLVPGLIVVRYLVVWANVALLDWVDGPDERRAGMKPSLESDDSAIRRRAVGAALTAAAGVAGLGVYGGLPPVLAGIETVGAAGMAVLLWTLRPRTQPSHRLILDAAVAWPLVTYIAATIRGI